MVVAPILVIRIHTGTSQKDLKILLAWAKNPGHLIFFLAANSDSQ
jgi:hypothetical protein